MLQHVGGDGVAQALPSRYGHAEEGAGDGDGPVDGHPAHGTGMHVVAGWGTQLPDPLVGVLPATLDRGDQLLHQPPVALGEGGSGPGEPPQQLHDRTEDVGLDLPVGCVADPHGTASPITLQLDFLGLRRKRTAVDGVDRRQAIRLHAVVYQPQQPVEQVRGLAGRAEAHEAGSGHRRVADPAVAVVPVAGAAEALGQAGGGCSDDCPGRTVAQRLQHERRPAHEIGLPGGHREPLRPAPLRRRGPLGGRCPLERGARTRRRRAPFPRGPSPGESVPPAPPSSRGSR